MSNDPSLRYFDLTKEEKEAINEYLESKGLPTCLNVTFEDVVAIEDYSDIDSRSEIYTFETELASGIHINIPIVSANMVGVTGERLAVALAREGSYGFIPQMFPLERRLKIIDYTQRSDSAFIEHPLKIRSYKTLSEARVVMEEHSIWSLVVVNEKNEPVGILSSRDWRYEEDCSKTVSSLMNSGGSRKLISVVDSITPEKLAQVFFDERVEKVPLIRRDGRLAGLYTARGFFYKKHYPRALRDELGRFPVMGSVGVNKNFKDKLLQEVEAQVERGITFLLVDTARAFSKITADVVENVKKLFPGLPIIVGNISTPRGAKFLFEHGADCVKVNQGRGSRCLTSEIGTGLPQLSAIAKCSVIARRYRKTVMADGAMEIPGDFANAIIAGANSLMSGKFFARSIEAEEPITRDKEGRKIRWYYGSASNEAQRKRIAEGNLDKMRRAEGFAEHVEIMGSVEERISDLLQAFSSAMSYYGARTLCELRSKGVFELQTPSGRFEGLKKYTNRKKQQHIKR